MKKCLALLSFFGGITSMVIPVMSCNNGKNPDDGFDNLDLMKKFNEKVTHFVTGSFREKITSGVLNQAFDDDSDSLKYLKTQAKELAQKNINSDCSENGINISNILDGNEVIKDVTKDSVLFNDNSIKEYITSLMNESEYSSLIPKGGNIYSGLFFDDSSTTLKFSKYPDNSFSQVSISFDISFNWNVNNLGSVVMDSNSISITLQLEKSDTIANAINEIVDNLSKSMYKEGSTRFISNEPTKDKEHFNYDWSNDMKYADNLKKYYSEDNLKKVIIPYLNDGSKFCGAIDKVFSEFKFDSELGNLSLNFDNLSVDEKNFKIISDYIVTGIGMRTYLTNGIPSYNPLLSLLGKKDTKDDAYKIIDNVLSDKNYTTFKDNNYESHFKEWIRKIDSKLDLNTDSSLAYGNFLINNLSVNILGSSYDLGNVYIDFDYSNHNETAKNSSGKEIEARNYYYDKLVLREFKSIQNNTGLISNDEVFTAKTDTFFTYPKTSMLYDFVKKNKYAIQSAGFITYQNSDIEGKISNDLGIDKNEISDSFNDFSALNSEKVDTVSFNFWSKKRTDSFLSYYDLKIGSIEFKFNFLDFMNDNIIGTDVTPETIKNFIKFV